MSRNYDQHQPLDRDAILKALRGAVKQKPVCVSIKAWKLLQRIMEAEPEFMPKTEAEIWLKGDDLGLEG